MINLTIALGVYECENWVFHLNRILNEISNKLKNYNELLIIDDRHVQNTKLEDFIDNKSIKYNIVRHGNNLKNLAVQNTAIQCCKSKYIWIIDMDDTILEYDFNKIDTNDFSPDMIYFDKVDFHHNGVESITSFFNFKYLKVKDYQIDLNIRTDNERIMLQLNYDNHVKAMWFKILNVEFMKSCIKEIDLSKFKLLRYSNDVLLNLFIFKNLKKISIINDKLPYIYDNRGVFNYLPVDKDGNPNYNIKPDVIKSWKWIYDNTSDFIIKKHWFNNLKETYANCVDFTKLNMD